MTDQMAEGQLDREIRGFLAWQAKDVGDAPTATEMALRVSTRVAMRSPGVRVAPQLVWVVLAGLLIVALMGALALAASTLRRDPLPISYEAVFLRLEMTTAESADLAVVAVDAAGKEREIGRVPDAGLHNGVRIVPAVGAVSPGGLLAVPRSSGSLRVHWEVINLHHPEAPPIVVGGIDQDAEQLPRTPYYDVAPRPGLFWGAGNRVLIPSYERRAAGLVDFQVHFVEGQTGAVASVDLPAGMLVVPQWAVDGSGVLVDDQPGAAATGPVVLQPNGTLAAEAVEVATGAYSRHYRHDGVEIRAVAGSVVADDPRAGPEELLSFREVELVDVSWTAGGDGIWLVLRDLGDPTRLRVERRVLGLTSVNVSTIVDESSEPGPDRMQAHLTGLAPDDSMIVLSTHRVTGTAENWGLSPSYSGLLLAPGTGESFHVDGAFAGWLEVIP